jgi:thiol-disulfide isomerase/thioredoxin
VSAKQRLAALFSILFLTISCSTGWAETTAELVPGEMAPPILASKWLRGTPVGQFESGHVYVIDLWSTWCKPCIAAMPTIYKLEHKFAGRATVIAMNVWEFSPQSIPKFLESHGDSMAAIVALDSIPEGKEVNEGLTAKAYLGTSESASIPKSFLIDQFGRVAWIGHPNNLEGPLSQVLAGTWDLRTFFKSYILERTTSEDTSGVR